jgi:hypothetical protein
VKEDQGSRIHGKVKYDGRGRFKNGEEIITTPVVSIHEGMVMTKSGSFYKLGMPHKSVFGLSDK